MCDILYCCEESLFWNSDTCDCREFSIPFDKYLGTSIHHDLGNVRIEDQVFYRPKERQDSLKLHNASSQQPSANLIEIGNIWVQVIRFQIANRPRLWIESVVRN